jgi:hypothetical protein
VNDGYGSIDTATVTVTVTGTANGGASVAMSEGRSGDSQSILSAFLPAGDQDMAGLLGIESLNMAQPVEVIATDWAIA